MAATLHLIFLTTFIFATVSCELSEELTENKQKCSSSCLKTFPTVTSNSVEKLSDACERGCRFFVLVNSRKPPTPVEIKNHRQEINKIIITNDIATDEQLIKSTSSPPTDPIPSARTNSSKEECQASCMEAYKHTRERYACHEGCANMARETSRMEERMKQEMLEEGARELASLAVVGPIISSMFNQLYSSVNQARVAVFMTTSDDDTKAQDVFLLEQPQQQEQTIFIRAGDSEPDDVLTDPALLHQLESVNNMDITLRIPEQSVRTFPVEHSQHTPRRQQQTPASVPVDLLGCLSTRSGMPKWLFGLMALVTGVVMVWLCLEPWDRAAILEESVANKNLLVDTDEEDEEKSPIINNEILPDMVKIPLEKV